MTTLAGIDVSNWQGPAFDWAAWKGKIAFAGIKVSEGTSYADPDAARNIAGARSIGAVVIGYHLVHAAGGGAAQAAWFLAHCQAAGLERGDILALDVEAAGLDGGQALRLWTAASDCAAAISSHFSCHPLVYAPLDLAGQAPASVAGCPLWLANPSGTPVIRVGPWPLVSFEQTGQSGTDADVFYGNQAQLSALAIPRLPDPVPPGPALAGIVVYEDSGQELTEHVVSTDDGATWKRAAA